MKLYTIELLPFNLMRSLYYKEVVDIMTHASFVKSQVLNLNVIDITSYLFFTKPYLSIAENSFKTKHIIKNSDKY